MSGAVYVNRHRNKIPASILYAGAVLEVYYDEQKFESDSQTASAPAVSLNESHILFEDEWIVLMNKPAGMPTQPTVDASRPNLFDLTKRLLSQRGGSPYLGLHHRLDRDTSGVVMFTKKEEANKGVSELFSGQQIRKTYQCIVWRASSSPTLQAEERFEVKNFLGRISEKSEKARYGSVHSNGDPAHTLFRVTEVFRDVYWLEAQPQTGRTHQIRVHASELGLPILGDPEYFPKKVFSMVVVPRLMLHAHFLEFPHPVTGTAMKVEAPLPDDFLKILGSLRA